MGRCMSNSDCTSLMEQTSADDVPPPSTRQPLVQTGPDPKDESKPRLVHEIARSKRKARPQRVCQPCRVRKVKCNYDTPCLACSERGHPELCQSSVEEPSKRTNTGLFLPSQPESDHNEHLQRLRAELGEVHSQITAICDVVQDLRDDIRSLRASLCLEGKHALVAPRSKPDPDTEPAQAIHEADVVEVLTAKNGLDGGAVCIGGNSVPAMVAALAKDANRNHAVHGILEKSILPIFCLDNESATYPFVDLWGIPHGSFQRIELLCKLLPATDAECIQTFGLYRDTAHVIYPGIVDIFTFESDLLVFLRNRSKHSSINPSTALAEQEVYGKSLHWLGLLFAALASGVQCSTLPRKERCMKSQVYVCCAYECLRIVNYISRATLDDLQNLLVVGNVLSNNMNAGVAWALMGLTMRLAQTLGLHYDAPSSDYTLGQTVRSSIWWQIIWQDSLLSVTFDRSSPTAVFASGLQSRTLSKLSYADSMRRLCKTGLDMVQQRAVSQSWEERSVRILKWHEFICEDSQQIAPHLRDISSCRTMREQLEYWNFYIHRSYILSELHRFSIRPGQVPKADENFEETSKTICIDNLANTVEAFLGLQNLTEFATQSWAAVHRSLSSALLLSILGEPTRSERVHNLVQELIAVMTTIISSLDASERSPPLMRSVDALHELNLHHRSRSQKGKYGPSEEVGAAQAQLDLSGLSLPAMGTFFDSSTTFMDYGKSPYSVIDSIFWGTSNSDVVEQ